MIRWRRTGSSRRPSWADDVLNQLDQIAPDEGLGKYVSVRAQLVADEVPRHENEREVGKLFPHPGRELRAPHHRHHDISHHQVHLADLSDDLQGPEHHGLPQARGSPRAGGQTRTAPAPQVRLPLKERPWRLGESAQRLVVLPMTVRFDWRGSTETSCLSRHDQLDDRWRHTESVKRHRELVSDCFRRPRFDVATFDHVQQLAVLHQRNRW